MNASGHGAAGHGNASAMSFEAPALGRPILFDGAMGTELLARGLDLHKEPPEAWCERRANDVRAVHAAHLGAGAQVLQTNTFGALGPRLARYGLGAAVERLCQAAVGLARQAASAAGRKVVVMASLGPCGADPFAADAQGQIQAVYAEAIAALLEAGIDGVHLETMMHPVETTAAMTAARRLAPRLPLLVSATYTLGDQGFQTPLGVPLGTMTRALVEAGPSLLGVNCSLEARKMVGLVKQLQTLTTLPLVVQPQGEPTEVECRGPRRAPDVAEFVRGMLALVALGPQAVGGCCGTSPAHLAALSAALGALA